MLRETPLSEFFQGRLFSSKYLEVPYKWTLIMITQKLINKKILTYLRKKKTQMLQSLKTICSSLNIEL